jgi:hypothetical protein
MVKECVHVSQSPGSRYIRNVSISRDDRRISNFRKEEGLILISERICFEMNILFSLTFSIDEKVTKNLGDVFKLG